MKQQVGYAIVGDGKFGFKHFGETFEHNGNARYWENRGYEAVPVYVEMSDDLKEFHQF